MIRGSGECFLWSLGFGGHNTTLLMANGLRRTDIPGRNYFICRKNEIEKYTRVCNSTSMVIEQILSGGLYIPLRRMATALVLSISIARISNTPVERR